MPELCGCKISTNQLQTTLYEVKRLVYNGRNYLSVPVVMLIEGVHCGSHGNILHEANEIGSNVSDWNNIPVTINHPQVDGMFVSVNTPGQEQNIVGKIVDPVFEDKKLKATALIDIQKLAAVSPQALAIIDETKPLDVSMGAFTDFELVAGEWNGEPYEAIAKTYHPDHLALLPGDRGACSWDDGCGIRVNQQNKKMMTNTICETIKTLNSKGFNVGMIVNVSGFQELLDAAYRKVNAMDTEERTYYLEEMFETHLIYSARSRGSNDALKLYLQNYKTENNDIVFEGEPEPVVKEVKYLTMKQRAEVGTNSINTNKNAKTMSDTKKAPKVLVDGLINNEFTRFAEGDRTWLEGQSDETLNKLEPKPQQQPQVNKEQALEALSLKKDDDYIDLMPDSLKNQVKAGLTLYKENRDKMVSEVMTNTEEGTWTREELEALSDEMLSKLTKTVKPKTDYSGAGGEEIQANAEGGDEILLPVGVKK